MFYDTFRSVCKKHGTTLTGELKAIGRSTGLTGRWRDGCDPSLTIVVELAAHMGVSLDELVLGVDHSSAEAKGISSEQQEWLDIISLIPEEKHAMLKDFLRTHMVVPEKYADREKA